MTFPTEQDRLFFTSEEAKRIQELWEPTFGDWVINGDGQLGIVRNVGAYSSLLISREGYMGGKRYEKESCIVLPRQDQLQEMLEERGIDWKLSRGMAKIRLPGQGWADEKLIIHRGFTPAIALGRALIEVLNSK